MKLLPGEGVFGQQCHVFVGVGNELHEHELPFEGTARPAEPDPASPPDGNHETGADDKPSAAGQTPEF